MKKARINGLQATYAAVEESVRGPVHLDPAEKQAIAIGPSPPVCPVGTKKPPRVRKPRPDVSRTPECPVGTSDLRTCARHEQDGPIPLDWNGRRLTCLVSYRFPAR